MSTAETAPFVPASTNPFLAGLRIFLADVGFSLLVGFLVGFGIGFGLGAVGVDAATEAVAQINMVGVAVGFLVSAYAAFLLYRRYTQSVQGLVALIAVGLTYSAISYFGQFLSGTVDLGQTLLVGLGQVVVYTLGWFVAKTYSFTPWLPGKRTVLAFAIFGGILVVLHVIGTVTQVVL